MQYRNRPSVIVRRALESVRRQPKPQAIEPVQRVEEQSREEERFTIEEALDSGRFTGYLSIQIFRSSPMRKGDLEATVLRQIVQDAHDRDVPIAQGYMEMAQGMSGRQAIETYLANDRTDPERVVSIMEQLRFDDAHPQRVYPGKQLAQWMTDRLAKWGYKAKIGPSDEKHRESEAGSIEQAKRSAIEAVVREQ